MSDEPKHYCKTLLKLDHVYQNHASNSKIKRATLRSITQNTRRCDAKFMGGQRGEGKAGALLRRAGTVQISRDVDFVSLRAQNQSAFFVSEAQGVSWARRESAGNFHRRRTCFSRQHQPPLLSEGGKYEHVQHTQNS
jgi:hypothetical protein